MEEGKLAVKFLGIALVLLIVGIILCFLASLGYNTYIKYSDDNKKIEVHAQNSNLDNLDNWYFGKDFSLPFIYISFVSFI